MSDPLSLIQTERLVALTEAMVRIPSITGQEEALSDWMARHFTAIGLQDVQRLPVEGAAETIVGVTPGDPDGPTLLFCFHMDTFPVFAGWESDPFAPRREGNRLYGLGAHDMKGGAACALVAVEAILAAGTRLPGRILVAATTDEENWSRGAHALIRSGLLAGCRGCLIPEPAAAGTLTVGARGRHVFHLTFAGKTVHAAYGGGINAAVDAARVAALLEKPSMMELGYDAEFDLSGSLAVIGIQSGGTLILVPEQADLYVDRHLLPGQSVEEAAEQIREVVEIAGIDGSYALTWDERPTPAPLAYRVPDAAPLVQTVRRRLAQATGAEIRPVLARSVADTNHLAVHGGIPTLICGPQGGNTCEANEYVLIDSMPAVAATYVQSALDLLGG